MNKKAANAETKMLKNFRKEPGELPYCSSRALDNKAWLLGGKIYRNEGWCRTFSQYQCVLIQM